MGAKINFLREYFSNPGSIGAVAPSSRILATRMLDGISLENATKVIELGPGTGAFTTGILKRISSQAKFIAIEKNPVFLAELRQRFDHIEIIEGDAENLVHLLHQRGIDAVDVVVSEQGCIVDEATQRAQTAGLRDQRCCSLGIREIGLDGNGAATSRVDLSDDLCSIVLRTAVVYGDRVTFSRQTQ